MRFTHIITINRNITGSNTLEDTKKVVAENVKASIQQTDNITDIDGGVISGDEYLLLTGANTDIRAADIVIDTETNDRYFVHTVNDFSKDGIAIKYKQAIMRTEAP